MLSVRTFVHSSVTKCTANKRLNLEAPIFAYTRKFKRQFRLSIFVQIVNVFGLHFQSKRFESNTFRSSDVNISQTAFDSTNIAIAEAFDIAYSLSIGIFKFDLGSF